MENTTLIVCPLATERAAYSGWLRSEGYRVAEADSADDALRRHRQSSFPLTIADLAASGANHADFIHSVRAINPEAELLMLGATDTGAAIAAMKAGATDVLLKPIQRGELIDSVAQLAVPTEVLRENRRLRDELHRRYDFSQIVARSPQMLRALSLAGRVAPTDSAVLLTGESGTGKELLARAIHMNSRRAHRPMVSINCAAIPETLIESELFGYRRGAFTGAGSDKPGVLCTANGGTVFLDEIGDLPVSTQGKLLRFLQDGTYFPLGSPWPRKTDARVLAATNANLPERVEAGRFRGDLYYRLAVFPLHLPPLRERRDDIPHLAHSFMEQIAPTVGKQVPGFSREAIVYLTQRQWPGNARELRNAIERAVIVSDSNLLTSADFRLTDPAHDLAGPTSPAGALSLPDHGIDLPELNRRLIAEALGRTSFNMSAAARLLGLTRPALRYRMKKYGLRNGTRA